MKKFFLLFLLLFGLNTISQAQILYGSENIHPETPNDVNDLFYNYQWGTASYGQTLFRLVKALEYKPLCGPNFSTSDTDLSEISDEDFFLGLAGRSCQPSRSFNKSQSFDISWTSSIEKIESEIREDMVVAVLDYGADFSHPDLQGSLAKDLSRCDTDGTLKVMKRQRVPRRRPGEESNEREEINKLVDQYDCVGWSFASDRKFPNGSNLVWDLQGHGTHVAGILAAVRGNSEGIVGVSNKIKVLPVKVFKTLEKDLVKKISDDEKFDNLISQVAKGLEYVVDSKKSGRRKIDVVNMSFGWPSRLSTPRVEKALQEVIDNDIMVVVAAGNDDVNVNLFPCAFPGVICVGSHSIDGKMSPFSNYGASVDILAPGELILSTSPKGQISKLFSESEIYDFMSGTSQAAPFVAGTVALLRGLFPNDSTNAIKARLLSSTKVNIKNDHRFSLSGALSLSQAVAQKKRPFLWPSLKQVNQTRVKNNLFSWSLPIENLWASASEVRVRLESLSSNVVLNEESFNLGGLASSGKQDLKVFGRVLDLNQSSRQLFKLKISYQNKHGVNYSEDYSFTSEFFVDTTSVNVKEVPIELSKKTRDNINFVFDQNQKKKGLESFFVKRIENSQIVSDKTEFHVPSFDTRDGVDGLLVNLLIKEPAGFVEKELAFLPRGQRYSIYKLDILSEYPGLEYVIRYEGVKSIVEEEGKKPKGIDPYVGFVIFDSWHRKIYGSLQLKPLANLPGRNFNPDNKDLVFETDADALKLAFAVRPKLLRNPHGTVNSLFFISQGNLSDEDNNSNLNSLIQEEFFSRHIYYLEKPKGQHYLKLRTLTSPANLKLIKDKFTNHMLEQGVIKSRVLHPNIMLNFMTILEQDQVNESINILSSFSMSSRINEGDDFVPVGGVNSNHFFVLKITPSKVPGKMNIDIEPFDQDRRLGLKFDPRKDKLGTYFSLNKAVYGSYLGIAGLGRSQSTISYLGLGGLSRFSSERDLNVTQPSEFEYLAFDLTSYSRGDKFYSLYRTDGELLLTTNGSHSMSFDSKELKVSSFLPQFSFQEIMVPTLYRGKRRAQSPAIFVNSSEIHNRRVYSWVVDEEKNDLKAPINLNIEVPENCLSLRPTKIQGSDDYQYTFFCRLEDKTWQFKYIPMEAL